MRALTLVLILLTLTACTTGGGAQLAIICGGGSGLAQFFGFAGEGKRIRHSDPEHVFTQQELDMLDQSCQDEPSAWDILDRLTPEGAQPDAVAKP